MKKWTILSSYGDQNYTIVVQCYSKEFYYPMGIQYEREGN